MSKLMAKHSAIGRRERGKGKRIRRRARHHGKEVDLALEKLRKPCLEARRDVVRTIGRGGAHIRARQRLQNFRRDARRIVARKVHGRSFRETRIVTKHEAREKRRQATASTRSGRPDHVQAMLGRDNPSIIPPSALGCSQS